MRKISVTLAVMSVLAPLGASALGIGDIRLRSSLNQTLNAEIPLVTSGSESIDDVKISLASPDAFSKAGIDRSYALTKLRFTPIQKRDGSYAIRVSSQDIIREPFLNFLVEVNWPQGRMLREFTVLLDPPSTFKEPSISSAELPETTAESRSTRPAPEADYTPRRAARSSHATEPTEKTRIRGASYGPVRPNETLSGIARLIAREMSVSQDQAMAALYQANPQAFIRNNMNALRAGQTLAIPDREAMLSIPSRMARRAAELPPKQGRLEEARQTASETAPGSQLKLLSPQDDKGRAGGSRDEGGKAKGDIALEVADTVKQENEEIRSRLNELEQQLGAMQRLLSLRDEQIASLRGQAAGSPVAAPTPAAATVQTTETPAIASTPAPLAATAVPAPAAQTTAAPIATPAQETAAAPKPPAAAVAPPPVKPAVKPPKPAPTPVEEPGFLDALLDEPLLLGTVGLGSLLLLGFIGWSVMRRRSAMMDDAESILAPNLRDRIPESASPTPILDAMPTEHIVVSSKSSFLSEFTPSDFDALSGEADEVDPISEADVYLAYGRYKQAEELITNAIAQHPERDECKLKLLEIHYATENRGAFQQYANELFEAGKDADSGFWDKVKEMGRELCPGNPLFSGVGDIQLDAAESAYLGGDLLDEHGGAQIEDDFIAELKRFEESKSGPDAGAHLASFDFDDALDLAPLQTEPDKEDTLGALDFEIPAVKPAEKPQAPKQDQGALELDNLIAFEPGPKTGAPGQSSAGAEQEKSLDDILVEMGAKDEGSDEVAALDFDMGLDFPVEKPPEAPASAPTLDTSDEDLFASLTDMDEQETKLDLAKAYIDMGDAATAREIIDDVLARGNEAQKKEANALLAKLEK